MQAREPSKRPLPDLTRLAIGVPGDGVSMLERLSRLTFGEVTSRTLAENREVFPLKIKWEDGAESYVEGARPLFDAPCLLRLRESSSTLEVETAQEQRTYPITWGDLDSVLDAVNRFYTALTPPWREAWPAAPADAGAASRALLELYRQQPGTEEQLDRAKGYQGHYYGCIRGAQKATTDNYDCFGRPKQAWDQYIEGIQALMVELPTTLYCTSVAEEPVEEAGVPAALPYFISATLNFAAVDAGDLDKYSFNNDTPGQPILFALTLLPGTRVLPLFGMQLNVHWAWEYEVLIDAGQRISKQNARKDALGRTVLMLTVGPPL